MQMQVLEQRVPPPPQRVPHQQHPASEGAEYLFGRGCCRVCGDADNHPTWVVHGAQLPNSAFYRYWCRSPEGEFCTTICGGCELSLGLTHILAHRRNPAEDLNNILAQVYTPLLGTQTRAHPAPSRDAARGPADGPFQPTPQGAPSRKREPIDVTELSVTPQGARGGRDVRIALVVGAILSDERHPHAEPPGDLLRQRISGGVRRSCSGLHLLGQHPMASLMIRTSWGHVG